MGICEFPLIIVFGMTGGGRLVGPAVNLYLKRYGLSITQVAGTGPKGTVSKGDVLQHVALNNLQPLPVGKLKIRG